jgi:branched-chain amino acid transport system permease protein
VSADGPKAKPEPRRLAIIERVAEHVARGADAAAVGTTLVLLRDAQPAIAAAALTGMAVEMFVVRKLYARDHLDQVLATFGLILFFNQSIVLLFGRQPMFVQIPPALSGAVDLGLFAYPVYRLCIIAAGLLTAGGLFWLIQRTRLGMLVRAGATHRDMVQALGVDIRLLYTIVFGLGALLAGFAGLMAGPLLSVQVGMGEQILILTFVVVVIGGLGSVAGAFWGALLVGVVDTGLRAFLPQLMRLMMNNSEADALAAGVSAMGIYLVMAIVLLVRPKGLFPGHA